MLTRIALKSLGQVKVGNLLVVCSRNFSPLTYSKVVLEDSRIIAFTGRMSASQKFRTSLMSSSKYYNAGVLEENPSHIQEHEPGGKVSISSGISLIGLRTTEPWSPRVVPPPGIPCITPIGYTDSLLKVGNLPRTAGSYTHSLIRWSDREERRNVTRCRTYTSDYWIAISNTNTVMWYLYCITHTDARFSSISMQAFGGQEQF